MTDESQDQIRDDPPRSVRYGLYSVFGVLILALPALGGVESPFCWGPIAIPALLVESGCPGVLGIPGTAILWYLVGSYLGKSELSPQAALRIWVVIQIAMMVFGVFTYIAFISVYN